MRCADLTFGINPPDKNNLQHREAESFLYFFGSDVFISHGFALYLYNTFKLTPFLFSHLSEFIHIVCPLQILTSNYLCYPFFFLLPPHPTYPPS